MAYVFSDLNARDGFVSSSTDVMLYDTKVVVQEAWRLITTEEGEVPNFRSYGLSLKKYIQYPLTKDTVNTIYNYIKGRVEAFIDRAEILKADVDVDFNSGRIFYEFYLRMRASGDVVKLPLFTVQVATA